MLHEAPLSSSPGTTGDTPKRRVLLIGWDAADWKTITPLLDAGKMPNLAKLVEGGVCGNLCTIQPVLSPMLWTSIATGKRAYKHGIHGFTEPDPVSGMIRPVTNLSRKTKAIWNILNQEKKKSVTIGWWPSNPAEELSRGVMISNDYQRSTGFDLENWPMKAGTVHPEKLAETLAEARFHPAQLTESELRFFLPGIEGMSRQELDRLEKDSRIQSLIRIVADCLSIQAAAMLMTHAPWDFMAVYYDAIDHFGHAFMRYHPPQRANIDDWDYRVFSHCLEAGYCFHDQMLGELIAQVGEDLTVVLMSDHGFHPDHLRPLSIPEEPAGPAVEHRQLGILVANGPGLRKDERVYGASVLDICPTLLHLFGLPVGEDMDGKVLLDLYADEPAPVERIPSWDNVAGDHGMHPPDRRIAPADSKAAITRLAALGYIEDPGEDLAKALEETVRELEFNLSVAYLDGGLYFQSTEILERLYERWPDEHRFGFRLATCYQYTLKSEALRNLVQKIIERRLREGQEGQAELRALGLDDAGVREAEERKMEKMELEEQQLFQTKRNKLIGKASPNLYSLLYLEAYADFAERNYETALTRLEKLDSDYGARMNALIFRGELLQRLRRWTEADDAFRAALDIEPETPGALSGLARSAMAEQRFADAVLYARQSIGILFFQPRVHYIHGMALYRLGAADDAEYAFLMCVTQAPLFSAGYRMLAEIYRYLKPDGAKFAHYSAEAKASLRRRREFLEYSADAAASQSEVSLSPEVIAPAHLQPRPEALAGIPAERIITIVSGLPRSGTSLMMQILDAAGIPLFTDNVREADESNQKGYHEYQKVASLRHSDLSWLAEARGSALKVVAPLLSALPGRLLPKDEDVDDEASLHYRVIYMERDIDEILLSQDHFLKRLGKESGAPGSAKGSVAQAFLQQVRDAKQWCARDGVDAISIDYGELVSSPETVIPEVAAFLGVDGRIPEMLACVDPSLYRARKET